MSFCILYHVSSFHGTLQHIFIVHIHNQAHSRHGNYALRNRDVIVLNNSTADVVDTVILSQIYSLTDRDVTYVVT